MAKGNTIIVTATPRGVFYEGPLNGALKPGICVQIDVSEGFDSTGRMTWEPYNTSVDGERRMVAVLREDIMQGKLATAAYVDGDRGFVYVPQIGEQMNCLLSDISGTADDHSFGDLLMIDDGTGELIDSNGTAESEPFILLEDVTDPTADTLVHVMFTGQ